MRWIRVCVCQSVQAYQNLGTDKLKLRLVSTEQVNGQCSSLVELERIYEDS